MQVRALQQSAELDPADSERRLTRNEARTAQQAAARARVSSPASCMAFKEPQLLGSPLSQLLKQQLVRVKGCSSTVLDVPKSLDSPA